MAAASVLGSSVAARAIHGGFDRAAMADNLWEALLTSLRADFLSLDERLADAETCSDRPLAIASIPYGYMHITIALHSARLGAECYLAGKTRSELQARLASDLLVRFNWRP